MNLNILISCLYFLSAVLQVCTTTPNSDNAEDETQNFPLGREALYQLKYNRGFLSRASIGMV